MVLRAVSQHPIDAADERRDPAVAVGVQHPHIDQVGRGRDTDELASGAVAVAGNDTSDMGAVTAGVRRLRIQRIGEINRGQNPVGGLREVRIGRDARVEYGNGDAAA